MPPAGFEHTIPASELPKTHALDRAATEIGVTICHIYKVILILIYLPRQHDLVISKFVKLFRDTLRTASRPVG
jgi:hypothetical protein